jgi:hypothetical protein
MATRSYSLDQQLAFRSLHAALTCRCLPEVQVRRTWKNRSFATAGWNAVINLVHAELARPAPACAFEEETIVQAQRFLGNVKDH